jgi:hypothetical protein
MQGRFALEPMRPNAPAINSFLFHFIVGFGKLRESFRNPLIEFTGTPLASFPC